MSWVEFDDTELGRVVTELQPTVVEVFRATSAETTRFHLRLLNVTLGGQNSGGDHIVQLANAGGPGVTLSIPDAQWPRVWPWVEHLRQLQATYQTPPGY